MEEKKDEKKVTTKKNTNNKGNSKKGSNNRKKTNNGNKNNNSNKTKTSSSKNVNKNTNKPKKVDDIELLDRTNSFDIIIDDDRLKDKESLDFSFIDGKGKKKKAKEEIEILEEVDYKEEAKKIESEVIKAKSNDAFSTGIIIVFSFILGFFICCIWAKESDHFKTVETVTEEVEKIVMDDNYVFVGDSIFEGYKLEKHFEGMPTINSGISGHKTRDILDNMNGRIYKYNPSKVFILIGTNDIGEIDSSETVQNIGKIIDGIQKNRKYAEIYVQSIYPVNKVVEDWKAAGERDNDVIKSMNKEIKDICNDKDVTYMDVYDLLADGEGNLKEEYSYDGLHLSDEGYKVITKEVMKVLK